MSCSQVIPGLMLLIGKEIGVREAMLGFVCESMGMGLVCESLFQAYRWFAMASFVNAITFPASLIS